MDAALSGFAALEQALRSRHDRRSVFLTAYLVITREIKRRVETNGFADNVWVGRYLVAFVNLYRQALADYEAGNLNAVPKAWKMSFQTSIGGSGLLMQDLLLGINAHINHDLALALDAVSIDPNRPQRYQDHSAVNAALAAATDQLKQQVMALYAPGLEPLDQAASPLDDWMALFSVAKAREAAWQFAVALANARDQGERQLITRCLDDGSAVLAQLILAPTLKDPQVVPVLRQIEQSTPWWERILAPAADPEPQ